MVWHTCKYLTMYTYMWASKLDRAVAFFLLITFTQLQLAKPTPSPDQVMAINSIFQSVMPTQILIYICAYEIDCHDRHGLSIAASITVYSTIMDEQLSLSLLIKSALNCKHVTTTKLRNIIIMVNIKIAKNSSG